MRITQTENKERLFQEWALHSDKTIEDYYSTLSDVQQSKLKSEVEQLAKIHNRFKHISKSLVFVSWVNAGMMIYFGQPKMIIAVCILCSIIGTALWYSRFRYLMLYDQMLKKIS